MLDRISNTKIVFVLILIQLAICVPFLAAYPIHLDEPFTIFWAQQDVSEMMGMFKNENNPPLHFMLLHFWVKAFGIGPFAVRSLSLLFGVLTVPALFKLGNKIGGKEVATIATLFFIFSTFNHYHVMEGRVYAIMVFLTVMIFHDLYTFIFESKKVFWRLAIWNAILMYSHYLAAVVITGEVVVFLLFFKHLDKKHFLFFALNGLIAAALYLPGLALLLERLGHFSDKGTWVPEPNLKEIYGNILRFLNYTLVSSILAGLVLVFAYINREKIRSNFKSDLFTSKSKFVFAAFLVPYFGMYLISEFFQPVFLDRYLLFTTPFLYLSFAFVVVFVLQEFSKKWMPILFVIPMIASCYYIPKVNRDGDAIAEYVKENRQEGDAILMCPPFYNLTFLYYYNRDMFKDYRNLEANQLKSNIHPVYNLNDAELLPNTKRLFMVDANSKFLFPDSKLFDDLNANFIWLGKEDFKGDYQVHLYAVPE